MNYRQAPTWLPGAILEELPTSIVVQWFELLWLACSQECAAGPLRTVPPSSCAAVKSSWRMWNCTGSVVLVTTLRVLNSSCDEAVSNNVTKKFVPKGIWMRQAIPIAREVWAWLGHYWPHGITV
jgi:hypothetical protein